MRNDRARVEVNLKLPCGCIIGEFECPDAIRLWREVNYQYGLLKGYPSSFEGWLDYDKALSIYREHKRKGDNLANVTYPILIWDKDACEHRAGRSTVLAPLNGVTPWAIGKGEPGERYGQNLAEAAIYESEE